MKVIIIVLVTVGFISCEVPPPYPPRNFRPSPPFNLPPRSNFNQRSQPQTTYGVPNSAPSKVALPSSPQNQYGVPNIRNVELLGIRSNSASNTSPNFNLKPTIPSTSYGVPITENNERLQNNFRIINSQPQTAYDAPNNLNNNLNRPQTQYGAPNNLNNNLNRPQTQYGAPNNLNNNLNRPQTQYGVPDTMNVETLEQIRQLNLLLQLRQSSKIAAQNQFDINLSQSQNSNRNVGAPTEQYLPVRNANNFRVDNTQSQNSNRNIEQPLQQYLPVKEANNFRKGLGYPPFNIPQRQIQNSPSSNFGVSPSLNPNLQLNNENVGIPPTQYRPSQSNRFDNNVQNNNNAKVLAQQYIPSEPNSQYQPTENRPNEIISKMIKQNSETNFNQQIPTNVNSNIPPFSNSNSNNFGRINTQENVDIQQADVRTLSQSNRNNNAVQTQIQFSKPSLKPRGHFKIPNTQGAEKESVDETYLPPTTTARSILRPSTRPDLISRPTEAPVQQDEESTESDGEAVGPNVAVSTAVAGSPAGQSFYLLQPDGRLQRVIYQKTREEGDQEHEYTANYLFQNIQADPALVYSPLITLGK